MRIGKNSVGAAGLAKIAGFMIICGLFLSGCDAQKSLTRKRIKSVEKGLMRLVYLKGLKPEKLRLAERMQFYHVPGVSIAVLDKNRMEWAKAYGEKDVQTREPLTTDTLFQAGALSQMMTAAAAFRLAEKGELGLDGNVNTALHSWKIPSDISSRKKFTPRGLMTHSAGLSDQIYEGYNQGEPLPSLRQILNGLKPANNVPVWAVRPQSLAFRTYYSEAGYVVLQQLVCDLVNKPFPAFMKETIFDPLGLRNSTFDVPLPENMKPNAASGHLREGQLTKGRWNNYPQAAAKGLWTTPSDFASFLAELLQAAEGAPGSEKILSLAAARTLLSPQIESFGFGFLVEGRGEDLNFNFRGKTRGFTSSMVIYPAKGQAAVIMTNSDNGFVLIQEILCALAEAYKWPHYKPGEKTVLRLDPAISQQYIGRYEVNPSYVLDVTREDYYLVVRPTGQASTKFYAESQTLFYSTDPYVRIQFRSDKQGKFDSLVLWQLDFELQAKKIN